MCHKMSGEEDVSKMQAKLCLVYLILIQIGLFKIIIFAECAKCQGIDIKYVPV